LNADCFWNEFDAELYFKHNYSSLRDDDRQIVEILRDFFRSGDIPDGAHGVDIGTGTNLYPTLAMLPFCHRVTMLDYSAASIKWLHDEMRRWSPSWHQVWQVLAKEAPYDMVRDLSALLASRARIVSGNIFEMPQQRWDVGTMCFVAESISSSKEEFHAASRAFLRSLRTGAPFVAAFMKNSRGYLIGKRWYPAVPIDESDVERCLGGLAGPVTVKLIDVREPLLREGYNGMIVAFGRAA
jgi:NNMT/PNMT/TEMT family